MTTKKLKQRKSIVSGTYISNIRGLRLNKTMRLKTCFYVGMETEIRFPESVVEECKKFLIKTSEAKQINPCIAVGGRLHLFYLCR